LIKREVWFKRPGQASSLTPKLGTAQLCKTSLDVTIARTFTCTGNGKWLSTVNNLYDVNPVSNSSSAKR